MSDPIQAVLDELRSAPGLQRIRFTRTFLSNVADVFEREGFATTDLYLRDKQTQRDLRAQADVLLSDVMPILRSCPRICENRAIGRYIIKALQSLQARQREGTR